jgi:hypothetical protein
MILINKNENKVVYLTLTEKATLTNPKWLFQFRSNDTNVDTLMMATAFSNNERFNAFTFSEGSTASFDGGFILEPGTYDYSVWETEYQSLDIASASNIVEVGLMQVLGTWSVYSTVYINNDNDYVYDPDE